jgi:hypothetical protein
VEPLHPDLTAAFSFDATPSGVVVATRAICPDGAQWGGAGTVAQTVLLDLSRPESGVSVLYEDANGQAGPLGRTATWISPDGRLIGVSKAISLEASQGEIVEVGALDVPLDLPSGCPNATDIIGGPITVGDDVLVARACQSGDETYTAIDRLALSDLSLEWTATIERSLNAYCNCVGISVGPGDVPSLIVSGTASVEDPTRSILIVGDRQTDITHFGFDGLYFPP